MYFYQVISIKKSCDDIKIFTLKPQKERLMFKPGQFIMLCLLDKNKGIIDKRPYSIASTPDEDNIELAIKMLNGRFTSKLDLLKEGEIIGVEGPYGHFFFNEEKKVVFIAGGVGITPLMSMLRTIIKKKIKGEYYLFYSCKTKKDILYKEELEKSNESGINVKIFLTREEDMQYESGRIEKDKIVKYIANPKEKKWFICGPIAMINTIKEALLELGVPSDSIKFEGWG